MAALPFANVRMHPVLPYPIVRLPWRLLFGLLCVLLPATLSAQQLSNLRQRLLPADAPLQTIDSLTLATPLVLARALPRGDTLPSDLFSMAGNRLLIDTAALRRRYPGTTHIQLQYRVLPLNLETRITRLDTTAIRKSVRKDLIEFDYTPYKPEKMPWESPGLQSSGAYTRGISFGNSQNLVFNSNLNLQLNGRLGNDLEILAALSDNSVPLQPDGTTRQLQEFDRVFVQIKRKQNTLTAGDFDLYRPGGSYFSYYFKRLQGAMADTRLALPTQAGRPPDSLFLRAAAAVTRGKFARQLIQGQEGNQGPYRLQGAEGERFIIVLAGTEKVFADGQLLRRGLTDDYIIDYNTGEVTFTARRLITKDIRIIVEFEYAVQQYLRTTTALQSEWLLGQQHRLQFSLYSEQDSRNTSGVDALSTTERQTLAQAGDRLNEAVASGVDTLAEFDPARVLYKSVDTLVCGSLRNILVYSKNPDSARYTVRFSEVPAGQGNYVQAVSAANGRVFRWVAPDPLTCAPQGNFEPVVRLLAPESRQLFTLGYTGKALKGSQIRTEAALSNRDYNRFSPLDHRDNLGVAAWVSYKQQWKISNQLQVQASGQLEQTSTHFQALNPYRPAEFVRDWNTGELRDTVAEQLARASLALQYRQNGQLQYELGRFERSGIYQGLRQTGKAQWQHKGFAFYGEFNLLESDGKIEKTRFSRPKLDISKGFYRNKNLWLTSGFYFEREKNERQPGGYDTLRPQSFQYDVYRIYLKTPEKQGGWFWNAGWQQRNDFAPRQANLAQSTRASEIFGGGSWTKQQKDLRQSLNGNLNWRQLSIIDTELTPLAAQETYLGRVDYSLTALKNAVTLTSGYEIGSGQSPRTEFSYLAVNPGQGQYSWIDRNRDSILQVDEMELAVFQDQANYIRVAVSTTEYIRTNNILFNQDLRLDPRALWAAKKSAWMRTLRRLSTQSTVRITRRSFAGAREVQLWNPFQAGLSDSSIVSQSTSSRNVLYINRAHPLWDLSLAHSIQQAQSALSTGTERRRTAEWSAHFRLNFGTQWSLEADGLLGVRQLENELLRTRDYHLEVWKAGPTLNWLPGRRFRMSAEMQLERDQNRIGALEKAGQTRFQMESSWNPAPREGGTAATSLRGKASLVQIQYSGAPNTAVAFAMLEGLQPGKNYLWSLTLDRQLSKSMQMNLSYEGRQTGGGRLIHVARAQVRAIF